MIERCLLFPRASNCQSVRKLSAPVNSKRTQTGYLSYLFRQTINRQFDIYRRFCHSNCIGRSLTHVRPNPANRYGQPLGSERILIDDLPGIEFKDSHVRMLKMELSSKKVQSGLETSICCTCKGNILEFADAPNRSSKGNELGLFLMLLKDYTQLGIRLEFQ